MPMVTAQPACRDGIRRAGFSRNPDSRDRFALLIRGELTIELATLVSRLPSSPPVVENTRSIAVVVSYGFSTYRTSDGGGGVVRLTGNSADR